MSGPTWGDYVEGTTAAAADAYAHGFAEGYRAAQEDAHSARVAAQVARAGVAAIDTVRARQKAEERARRIATEYRVEVAS